MNYINQLEPKIEKIIDRKVNFALSKFNSIQKHIVLYEANQNLKKKLDHGDNFL